MKKITIVVIFITIISKIFGFIRELIFSYYFGTSYISDAYLISQTIPIVIFGFIGTGIVSVIVPIVTQLYYKSGQEKVNKFISNLTNLVLLFATVLLVFFFFFPEHVVRLFAFGFSNETFNLTVNFSKISIFGLYFTILTSIFSSYLQIKQKHYLVSLIGFPYSLIIFVSIYIGYKYNIYLLVIGTLIASISQFIFLAIFLRKNNFKYYSLFNFNDSSIKQTFLLALPIILSLSVNQFNILVDKSIATTLSVGAVSALNYADKINSFVHGIFTLSIVIVMYPLISIHENNNNRTSFINTINESMKLIIIFVGPMSIGALFYSYEIIDFLFGRGAFDESAIRMTSNALFFYAFGMIGVGLREVFSRVFYTLKDTKTPLINASIGFAINIILNLILSRFMGIGGLALATSLSASLTVILMIFSLKRKIRSFEIKEIVFKALVVFLTSLIIMFCSKILYFNLISFLSKYISLLISIFLSGIIYLFVIIYFLKFSELILIKDRINYFFVNIFRVK
jgi:putative peptidoglycan lipid II flippase